MRDFHSAPFDLGILAVLFRGETLAELLPYFRDSVPLLKVVLECVTPTSPGCIQTCDHFINAGKITGDCLGQISRINCVLGGLHGQQLLFMESWVKLTLRNTLLEVETLINLSLAHLTAAKLNYTTVRVLDELLKLLVLASEGVLATVTNELVTA